MNLFTFGLSSILSGTCDTPARSQPTAGHGFSAQSSGHASIKQEQQIADDNRFWQREQSKEAAQRLRTASLVEPLSCSEGNVRTGQGLGIL